MRLAVPIVLLLAVVLAACGSGDGATFDVDIQFNESVQQEDIDQVRDLLATFDAGLEFVVLEIFPPQGRATVETDDPDFCQTVLDELETRTYVDSVRCQPTAEG